MIQLGNVPAGQQAAWQALFELHALFPQHWVLVGGQNVYLHAIERGAAIVRPTTDADTGLDLRARPHILRDFTATLVDMGFASAGQSPEGHEHRWVRGSAIIDVLIPRGTGERSSSRPGTTGSTTIESPAIQTAIDRAETVKVSTRVSHGNINRADIVGALIGKGAALRIFNDPKRDRHLSDGMTLLSVIAARELRRDDYRPAERAHLALLLNHLAANMRIVDSFEDGPAHLDRLRRVAGKWSTTDPNVRLL